MSLRSETNVALYVVAGSLLSTCLLGQLPFLPIFTRIIPSQEDQPEISLPLHYSDPIFRSHYIALFFSVALNVFYVQYVFHIYYVYWIVFVSACLK